MRLDLSRAAERILHRATQPTLWGDVAFFQLVTGGNGASAATLLYALAAEEECRASEWLVAEGITLETISLAFGIRVPQEKNSPPENSPPENAEKVLEKTDNVKSISRATTFSPMRMPAKISAKSPENSAAPEISEEPESNLTLQTPPTQIPLPLTIQSLTIPPPTQTSSIPFFAPPAAKKTRGMIYFVEGEQISIGRISPEIEELLATVWQRTLRLSDSAPSDFRQSDRGVLRVKRDARRNFHDWGFALATEHLLFALTLDAGQVGVWLRQHSAFEPNTLFNRIEQLYEKTSLAENESESLAPLDFEVLESYSPENFAAEFAEEKIVLPPSEKIFAARTPTKNSTNVMRLLDASANRAREAMRVLEDYARFVLDDAAVTQTLKNLRHELAETLQCLPPHERLASRETTRDVGISLEANGEYDRADESQILAANCARLSESLRSLEEFLKIDFPAAARQIEQLRYRCYTAEKEIWGKEIPCAPSENLLPENNSDEDEPCANDFSEIDAAENSLPEIDSSENNFSVSNLPEKRARLARSRLYVLVDGNLNEEIFRDYVSLLVESGVSVLQLRAKNMSDQEILSRGKIMRELTQNTETLFVMNDRIDLALATCADGVHLGQDELNLLNLQVAREQTENKLLLGISTHSFEQVLAAQDADYLGIGPVFPSPTKPQLTEFIEPETLAQIAQQITIPVFAIGGITLENLPQILESGINRAAISSAISASITNINSGEISDEVRKNLASRIHEFLLVLYS